MYIEIDDTSGFCYGVKNTINLAEKVLKDGFQPVYCIGAIVHNDREVNRLSSTGVKFIDCTELEKIHHSVILIRTHGEPASTFDLIKKNNNLCYDGTCPIVKTLHKKVRKANQLMDQINGQVVLYGKKKHPEVIGIIGQTAVNVIVVEDLTDLEQLDFTRPISLLSQTTQQVEEFYKLGAIVKQRMSQFFKEGEIPLTMINSTCNHVKQRANHLKEFVRKFETIIFISGKNSSNGKILYEVCKENNQQTHWIDNNSELDINWFHFSSTVGICGATSTPRWQLEEASGKIKLLITDYEGNQQD